MNQVLTTLPAHYDGKQVQLDVDYPLKPNTRLLITILPESLPEEVTYEQMVRDAMKVSEPSFARVWDNDEDAVYDNL